MLPRSQAPASRCRDRRPRETRLRAAACGHDSWPAHPALARQDRTRLHRCGTLFWSRFGGLAFRGLQGRTDTPGDGRSPYDYPTFVRRHNTPRSSMVGKRRNVRQVRWRLQRLRRIDLRRGATYKPPKPSLCSLSAQACASARRSARRDSLEAHLSAIAARPQTAPRFPCPHGDFGWPEGPGAPPRQRAQASVGLAPTAPLRR